MHKLDVSGTPQEMGCAHGEHLRIAIQELAEIRRGILLAQPGINEEPLVNTCRHLLCSIETATPEFYAELLAIAAGANITPLDALIAGAFSDVGDCVSVSSLMSECTTLAMADDSPAGMPLVFGTWDSHPSAQDALVLIRRKPRGKPAVLGLTSAGTPIQQGLNENGLAFAVNNLKPVPAREGVVYTASLAQIASTSSTSAAGNALQRFDHASGHYYPCADAAGRAIGFETDCAGVWIIEPSGGVILHTNHYLRAGDPGIMYSSTLDRFSTGIEFLATWDGSTNQIWSFLASHAEAGPICRHGESDVRSCAAFLLNPRTRTLEYTSGPACSASRFSETL